MILQCHACGAKFRSMSAEAKHRHNFPMLCKRNKQFAAFVAETELKNKNPSHDAKIGAAVDLNPKT